MAELVLGIGSSHGPMLNTPPDQWHQRGDADRRNPALFYRGREYDFDALVRERGTAEFEPRLAPDVWREQHRACRAAITQLAETFDEVAPDVTIIISSDHREVFGDPSQQLSLLLYTGAEADHVPFTQAQLDAMPPGLAIAEVHNVPPVASKVPCSPELAEHLVHALCEDGFQVATSAQLPPGRRENHSIPHGYGFVYRHIMRDDVRPSVPVFLNTFYPPNQPPAWRCYELGRAMADAVAAWPEDIRVAIVASGGLSHFVVEEDLDQLVLAALQSGDPEPLRELPTDRLQSGTSEIRSWVTVAGAMATRDTTMKLLDYVPCYRSEAGTGCAMAFGTWVP